ncbi:MAG: 16S rRNA (adenine(1518)-N(6)/adenine(1519)-N(6))-dimethyltransferase RsmA [bacterium]
MTSDLSSPKELARIFKASNFIPRRERSQNFMIDRSVIKEMVSVSKVNKNDTVLEIGPGVGILTEELLKNAKKVVAVEIDSNLVQILKKRLGQTSNLQAVKDDIRTVHLLNLGLVDRQYHLISNLPYQITSLVLKNFLSLEPKPQKMTLVIQKEVAERLVAPQGKKSLLTISVEVYGRAIFHKIVTADSFWPQPKVDSALITIELYPKAQYRDLKKFFQVVKSGFRNKRKQLHNSLSAGLGIDQEKIITTLKSININPASRPQELVLDQWCEIADNIV